MLCCNCCENKAFTGWTELDKTAKVPENEWRKSLNYFLSDEAPMLYWKLKPWSKPVFICKDCKNITRELK